jgi:hypothetical protein
MRHLVYARVEYLGFLCCLIFSEVFAIRASLKSLSRR